MAKLVSSNGRWLLHTAWDVAHHLYGHPIMNFAPGSWAGCAVCDTVLALWFFAGAPSVYEMLAGRAGAAARARVDRAT